MAVLRARWKCVAVPVVTAIVIAGLASILLPKRYTATATLVVDIRSPDPVTGTALQGMLSPSYMNTQVELITSAPVARRAVVELRLAEDPRVVEKWRSGTGGVGDFETWAAELIGRDLTVAPSKDSNVLDLRYDAGDAATAAKRANAFAKAFVEATLALRVEPAKAHKAFFDAKSVQSRQDLEAAQTRLSQFERKHGLGDEKQVDIEQSRLIEMSAQLVTLQGQETDARTRRQQGSTDVLPESIQNSLMIQLRGDLQRELAKLQNLRAKHGEAHPNVAEVRATVAALKQSIAEETNRISSSVAVAGDMLERRVAELRASIDAQRTRVAQMKSLRDDAVALRREVENAQRAYDMVLTRANQMALESQVAQTNVSIVGLAVEPIKPSAPKPLRNVLAALLLGTLAGLAWALIREFRDQRLRVDETVMAVLQQPVIVTLPQFGPRALANSRPPRVKRLTAA